MIESQTDYYLEIYSNLSGNQNSLLIAISKDGGNIFSKEYMAKHNLSTVSSTQNKFENIRKSGRELKRKIIDDLIFNRKCNKNDVLFSIDSSKKALAKS